MPFFAMKTPGPPVRRVVFDSECTLRPFDRLMAGKLKAGNTEHRMQEKT